MRKVKWILSAFVLTMAFLFNGCHDIENEIENDFLSLKSAETVEVAGDVFLSPVKFMRGKGKTVAETLTLDENGVENFAPDFMLYLKNGIEEGNRVSSAIVKLDGKQLFGPSDFSQQVDQLSVPVSGITSESVLEVEVRGEPGGFVEIWIEGTLLEEENAYKMYFISRTRGELFGVLNDDTFLSLRKFEGHVSELQIFNNKLYVLGFSEGKPAIFVLDYNGNESEILYFPEEVDLPIIGFTILPDGRFAVYNNSDREVYFLNSDFSFITVVSYAGSGLPSMEGVVVGNDLIIAENGHRKLLKIDLTTYEVSFFRDFSNLSDEWLALGAITYFDGTFYLCTRKNVYSFKNGETENLVASLPTENNVDIDINGNLAYVSNNFGGTIYKINLTDGSYSSYINMIQVNDLEIVK